MRFLKNILFLPLKRGLVVVEINRNFGLKRPSLLLNEVHFVRRGHRNEVNWLINYAFKVVCEVQMVSWVRPVR